VYNFIALSYTARLLTTIHTKSRFIVSVHIDDIGLFSMLWYVSKLLPFEAIRTI